MDRLKTYEQFSNRINENFYYQDCIEQKNDRFFLDISKLSNICMDNYKYEKELKKLLLDREIVFQTYNTGIGEEENLFSRNREQKTIFVKDIIVDVNVGDRMEGNQVTVKTSKGEKFYLFYTKNSVEIIPDETFLDFLENEKKKQEEIRLKHMDVDPYGEEDWTSESVDENKPLEFSIDDLFNTFENDTNKVCDFLNGFDFDIIIVKEKGEMKYRHKVNKFYSAPSRNKIYIINPNNGGMWDIIPGDTIVLKKKEELRLKHLEIDPYGEEDWEE